MSKAKPANGVNHRSAVTGKFITESQAKSKPRESVKERRTTPKSSPKGGK